MSTFPTVDGGSLTSGGFILRFVDTVMLYDFFTKVFTIIKPKIWENIFGTVLQASNQSQVQDVIWATKKNLALLSIESWLFSRDPYNGL